MPAGDNSLSTRNNLWAVRLNSLPTRDDLRVVHLNSILLCCFGCGPPSLAPSECPFRVALFIDLVLALLQRPPPCTLFMLFHDLKVFEFCFGFFSDSDYVLQDVA
ncbi:hypothetical protein XENORESO_011159 [Xenotaenia resolanae]|uniref:Uncharacterized protein n=1 Tax=Xenotaenia resolanae TaxID=208358 RepID=A0ABV0X8D6_9TELE